MRHPVIPTIDQWYKDRDGDELFKVVAKSLSNDYIEIQYFSGSIEELDFDTWFSLHLDTMPDPEDSSGPFELSQEDLGYDSEAKPHYPYFHPLAQLELYRSSESYDTDSFNKNDTYDQYESYFENYQLYNRFQKNDS